MNLALCVSRREQDSSGKFALKHNMFFSRRKKAFACFVHVFRHLSKNSAGDIISVLFGKCFLFAGNENGTAMPCDLKKREIGFIG
jgi:hypothetical protein